MNDVEHGARVPFLRAMGIRLTEVGDRHAVMEVDVGLDHRNYYGGAHGGLIASLVDSVCFFARPLIPSGLRLTTTSLAVTYIRPARVGDHLVARSQLLHLGRRTASLSVQVADGGGRLVAHGSATLMVLDEAPGDPAGQGAHDPPEALAARAPAADDGRVRLTLPQPYEELPHTADVGIAVAGATPEETLARLVLALGAMLSGGGEVSARGEELLVTAGGPDLAQVAVATLREVLFRFATRHLVPCACEARSVTPAGAELTVAFGPYDEALHGEGVDVKAVTYHGARFERAAKGWRAQVILDI